MESIETKIINEFLSKLDYSKNIDYKFISNQVGKLLGCSSAGVKFIYDKKREYNDIENKMYESKEYLKEIEITFFENNNDVDYNIKRHTYKLEQINS